MAKRNEYDLFIRRLQKLGIDYRIITRNEGLVVCLDAEKMANKFNHEGGFLGSIPWTPCAMKTSTA